jgi:hypothetical protein
MVIEGFIREDWINFIRFMELDQYWGKHQPNQTILRFPSIFSLENKRLDKRNRHPKVKIRIIIEEIQ